MFSTLFLITSTLKIERLLRVLYVIVLYVIFDYVYVVQ